jgi:valyl-tRNA synthetase
MNRYVSKGRNFANKIWNAFRLINGWQQNAASMPADDRDYTAAVSWFQSKLDAEITNINDLYAKYRISEALMATYKLIWDDFCSWYLELVKPALGCSMKKEVLEATISSFETLLKLLHPFMPFITEEIWHSLKERNENDFIIVASWPKVINANTQILSDFDAAAELVSQIRNLRKTKNIPMREALPVTYLKGSFAGHEQFHSLVSKLCNLSELTEVQEKPTGQNSIVIREHEYFIDAGNMINKDEERIRIKSELDYTVSFLDSVMKKIKQRAVHGQC